MALSSYDVRFILSVSDRTGNSLRRFAGDMRSTTAEAARMKKAFTAMDLGRGLAIRGLLAGAGLGVAGEQAASFATQVTKAATQIAGNNSVQKIGQNSIKLQKELLDLMHQFPGTAKEQADAAYDIFSAMNVPLQKGVGLLKLFNMVAVAGATDLSTASDAMIKILNNFGGSWERTMKSINTSFAIIRFGKLEFSEFNTMLDSVVPAAKGAGQSLQDVAGAMAFLTTRMGPAVAATGLSRLLDVMARPDFRRGAERLGLDFETVDKSLRPLPDLIHELARLPVAQIKGAIGSLIPLVTSVGRGGGKGIQAQSQARRTLNQLVLNERQFQQFQGNVLGATEEFSKRYAAMIGTSGVRWEKFKATLQATAIVVGAAVIPYFERLGEVITKGINWAKNNEGTVKFAAKALLAVSVASLLAGTFLKLYGASLILYTGLTRLAGAFAFANIAARATALMGFLSAAFSLLRTNGLKALPVILMNLGALSTLAKLGIITTTVVILWEVHKLKGWNEFWKSVDEKILSGTGAIKKHGGAVGKAVAIPIQALINMDKKVRVKNLAELKANRNKGKGSNKEIVDAYTSNYKEMIASIRKSVGSLSKDLFNTKAMKALGLDPKSIEDQINALLYPPAKGSTEGAQRAAQYAKDVVNRTKEMLGQASDALMQLYDGFKQANQTAFGDIFTPIEGEGEEAQLRKQWNWSGGADSLLGIMKSRVAQFKKWRGMLTMLLKKGFSKDFVDEFKKMGPEGLKYLDELRSAAPNKVRQFNTVMAQGKGAVTKATEIDFNTQLKKWNSFGKDTALKIILGMESEEQGVQTRMTNLVNRLYTNVAKEIAAQQVKLEMSVPDATVKFDYSGLKAAPEEDTTKPAPKAPPPKYGPHGKPPPKGSRGDIPFWWKEDQSMMLPGRVSTIPIEQRGMISPQTNQQVVFNVNGTFLTYQEMMDAALRQAKHKLKHTR